MDKICCFTGHRPAKFSFKYDENHPDCLKIKGLLSLAVVQAINEGFNYFISGMAIGVDTWAAEAVLKLKREYPNIRLEAAIPCTGQEGLWPAPAKRRYHNILAQADVAHYCSKEKYSGQLMILRDMYMVDKSSLLIAVFDGTQGGTKHTYDYAKKKGNPIIRIHPGAMTIIKEDRNLTEDRSKGIYNKNGKWILECSSKGDKRFSAFYAYVTVFGKRANIEDHYQLAKRFGSEVPKTWRDAKGKQPSHLHINGIDYDAKYLELWYKTLWIQYFRENPELVEYIKQFDDFNDVFKGKNTVCCQADVIREYAKDGKKIVGDFSFGLV